MALIANISDLAGDKTEMNSQVDHSKIKFVIKEATDREEIKVSSPDVEYHDMNERALHKILTNTLKYYEFNDNYTSDTIMKLYSEHDLIKYASMATNDGNPRELNSIIDLGEYPIATVFNKRKSEATDIESQNKVGQAGAQEFGQKLTKKANKYRDVSSSDINFLPPRPNKYLDVITYSECSPNFQIREDQMNEETLQLTNTDRNEFFITVAKANDILKPLRGRVASQDRLILLYLVFGLLIASTLGVVAAMLIHYAIAIVVGIVYFVILGSLVYVSKKHASKLIKKAHL